jgi:hypothetical protein
MQDLPVSGLFLLPEMRKLLRFAFRLILSRKRASRFPYSLLDGAKYRSRPAPHRLPRAISFAQAAIAEMSARADEARRILWRAGRATYLRRITE